MGLGQSANASAQLEALWYISSPNDDFRELPPAYLDKFIAEQLQPDEAFNDLVSEALHNLYLYLQVNMRPPTVKGLIKGGSMGKGTALKGRSDLDCILFMNGVSDARDLKTNMTGILDQLKELLNTDPLRKSGWGIKIIRDNIFMVQIEMQNFERNERVEVDILPTFYAAVRDEYSRRQLYNSMAEYDWYAQALCSAALAELQRDFIKQRPPKLKSLIRLVKHWGKTYLPREYGQPRMPNSYMLELLTIDVWEKAGSPACFVTAVLFKDVMEALYNHKQLFVKWDTYYSSSWSQIAKYLVHQYVMHWPQIMDPANPYNNVYEVVGDWKRVKKIAIETLKKPLLKNYSSSVLVAEKRRTAIYRFFFFSGLFFFVVFFCILWTFLILK